MEVKDEQSRTRTPDPPAGEEAADHMADSAEGLWLILLFLDPYGGSFNVPGDLTTMPMTLPTEVVENVRETLMERTLTR